MVSLIQNAIKTLDELIDMTEKDIGDIKEAKHDEQIKRLESKDQKVQEFERNKALVDREIVKRLNQNSDLSIDNALTAEEKEQLNLLKKKLETLQKLNQRYAKLVSAVGSLFTTFLERVLPSDMNGFNKVGSKSTSFMEVRA